VRVDEVVPLLLETCPSAEAAWRDHVQYWKPETRGYFLDVAVFAQHLVEEFDRGSTNEFPAFFQLLERMIVEGDQEVIDLAVVGLIEGIQNIASHGEFGYRVFEKWLGPKSRQGWVEIEAAWEGKSSLAEVIRAERKREN